jgi:predicted RNase H-like HicB family nuclease
MKIETTIATFTVIIEKDTDGYFARCHDLQGCYAQGDTYEDVIDNIKEVIALHIEDRVEKQEQFINSDEKSVSLTTISLEIPMHVT